MKLTSVQATAKLVIKLKAAAANKVEKTDKKEVQEALQTTWVLKGELRDGEVDAYRKHDHNSVDSLKSFRYTQLAKPARFRCNIYYQSCDKGFDAGHF